MTDERVVVNASPLIALSERLITNLLRAAGEGADP